MKFSRSILYIFLIIATLLSIKYFFINPKGTVINNTSVKTQKFPVLIKVVTSGRLLNKIYASGSLISNEEVVIMSEISGRIDKIYFKEGSKVKKGDLLVKLVDSDLQAALKKLKLQLKLSEEQENRQQKLLAINGISQETYDIALNQVNLIKAEVEVNAVQLAKTYIKAPFFGIIGLKNCSEGSFISPAVKIATLQQTDPIKIDFSIPEKYMNRIKIKDQIQFTVAGNDSLYTGSIYAIEPQVDPVNRSLPVRAIMTNKSGILFPGSFARIELILGNVPDALLIPTQALIPELKGQKVFICRNGQAQSVSVKTGIRTDAEIQITEGLTVGDSLIVSGFMSLKDGFELQVKANK